MHVSKIHIQGNGLVGLYIVPMNDFVIVGPETPEELDATLEEVFKAKVVRTTIVGTSLVGVFLATNGEVLIVPHIIFDHEREVLDKVGVPYKIIQSNFTCHGNNIVANKHAAIISPEYEENAAKEIKEALGTEIYPGTVDLVPSIGSLIVTNDTHALVSHDISDEEFDFIKEKLRVSLDVGTVNMGSTNIHSGIALNNNGFVIGDQSGGPEIVNADEVLGFLDRENEKNDAVRKGGSEE